jgi:hypothetical protein
MLHNIWVLFRARQATINDDGSTESDRIMDFHREEEKTRLGGALSKSFIRHYVVVRARLNKIGGRYASNSGRKAASTRFGSKNKMQPNFWHHSTGSNREFTYDATREKFAKPVRRIAGVTVSSEYRVIAKK